MTNEQQPAEASIRYHTQRQLVAKLAALNLPHSYNIIKKYKLNGLIPEPGFFLVGKLGKETKWSVYSDAQIEQIVEIIQTHVDSGKTRGAYKAAGSAAVEQGADLW
jgi:hypothetical protein